MEHWTDQGVVINVLPHGEGAAVLKLFTLERGLHAGYVHGATSSSKRALLECGNQLHAEWNAKTDDQLGTYKLEMEQQFTALIMEDRQKMVALNAMCALLSESLPEREAHPELYQTTIALLTIMAHSLNTAEAWMPAYIKWEIALLRELGFSLDLTRCAGGGNAQELGYMSPKSGCAVSYSAGEPYKDKLLPLPSFLKPNAGPAEEEDIQKGLNMTGVFLQKWAFAQHTQGVPSARLALKDLFEITPEDQA